MHDLVELGEVILVCITVFFFLLWFDEEFSNVPKDPNRTGFRVDTLRALKRAMREGGVAVVIVSLLVYPFVWIYRRFDNWWKRFKKNVLEEMEW